jgi:hypothetical protein
MVLHDEMYVVEFEGNVLRSKLLPLEPYLAQQNLTTHKRTYFTILLIFKKTIFFLVARTDSVFLCSQSHSNADKIVALIRCRAGDNGFQIPGGLFAGGLSPKKTLKPIKK